VENVANNDNAKQLLCVSKAYEHSRYSITERRVPEPIPVLGSQPAGDVSRKPGGRLPLFPPALQLLVDGFIARVDGLTARVHGPSIRV